MGIKRHKIHQGSLCSFVLLGRSLPDIDFETKTTPSAFWCKIHDAGSAGSHGDFTRNLVAEMRCSQKKKLLLINGTLNRNARVYVYIKSRKQHTSLHLPYMRVTDISKHINKHRLYNVVARHTNSILNSTQTDWATVAPPLLRWFFFFKFSYRQKGGGAYGLRIRSAIQILTGIYIEVKWSHFTSTNANTNSTVTSLRVCYFCMS